MRPCPNTETVCSVLKSARVNTLTDSAVEYNKGPIAEYDARVKAGTLRNDDHQRSMQLPAQ